MFNVMETDIGDYGSDPCMFVFKFRSRSNLHTDN